MTDHCGYSVTDKHGEEQPCGRPIAGHRWYQDVGEHEDMLDTACDLHANEGGRLIAELLAEQDRLREGIEKLVEKCSRQATPGPDEVLPWGWGFINANSVIADDLRALLANPSTPDTGLRKPVFRKEAGMDTVALEDLDGGVER